LEALTPEFFNWVREEAHNRASLKLAAAFVDDAVGFAMDKITRFLEDSASRVTYPRAWAETVLANALNDYLELKHRPRLDATVERVLDESSTTQGGEDEGEEADFAWYTITVPLEDLRLTPGLYPEHRWLQRILGLWKYKGWFSSETAAGWLYDRRSTRATRRLVRRLIIAEYRARRNLYQQSNVLLDGIPGMAAQKMVQRYLWGWRTTDIAGEFQVSVSRVSQVINRWTESWHWDKEQIERIKLIHLTKHLANMTSFDKRTESGNHEFPWPDTGFPEEDRRLFILREQLRRLPSEKDRTEDDWREFESLFHELVSIQERVQRREGIKRVFDPAWQREQDIKRARSPSEEQTVALRFLSACLRAPQLKAYLQSPPIRSTDAQGLVSAGNQCAGYWDDNAYSRG